MRDVVISKEFRRGAKGIKNKKAIIDCEYTFWFKYSVHFSSFFWPTQIDCNLNALSHHQPAAFKCRNSPGIKIP